MKNEKEFIEITTVDKCANNCVFCPQQVFQKNYQGDSLLSLENFKTALSKIPINVDITFSGFAEPFLNPHCIDMIEYAHSKGHKIQLYTTLVGMKLEYVERLNQYDPMLFLHLPDNLGNTKILVTDEYTKVLVKVLQTMTVEYFVVMNKNFISNGRAGLCIGARKKDLKGWFYCGKLVSPQFVMLPNCDVVLCGMDFGLKHKLGNLLESSYKEIVQSKEYKRISKNRYKYNHDSICAKCVWAIPVYTRLLNGLARRAKIIK
jgi:radical SAM protein with 4Fe4S-binding SPASM domain